MRNWLERQRAALAAQLGDLSRPTVPEPEQVEDSEAQQAVNRLVDDLAARLPDDAGDRSEDEHGRWLLAQLLNWHRREGKSFWWRYFYLREELTDEERRDESDALGVLAFERDWPDPAPRARSSIYRFRFPPQEHRIRVGDQPHDPVTGSAAGTVFEVGEDHIDLRLGRGRPAPTPTSLIPHDYVRPTPKPESLQRLARRVIEHGMDGPGEYRAGRDLLMRRAPRAGRREGQPLRGDDAAQDAARRLVLALDESYLAIQGPPGSGKSTVGARMIVDLVAAGKRVGVAANSHKVIGELLEKTASDARARGIAVAIGQRTGEPETTYREAVRLGSNAEARDALHDGTLDVVGGTGWLWARNEMVRSVDVLFIDEAGQMSLADAIAASSCATNLVLLGDPQQLDQPLQGTHPPGAERSALAHVLDGEQVMPDHLGLFSTARGACIRVSAPIRPRCSMRDGCTPIRAANPSRSPGIRRSTGPASDSFPYRTMATPASRRRKPSRLRRPCANCSPRVRRGPMRGEQAGRSPRGTS